MPARRLLMSSLMILGSLLASCAPAAAPPAAAPSVEISATKLAAPTPAVKPAEQPRYGGVFTFLTAGDPPSFDAHQEGTYMTYHPVGPATSSLIQFDPMENTKVIPDLAERWEASSDGLTYTFYLRKGAKFHNGSPVTAEDARFSLDRMQHPPQGMVSARQSTLQLVKALEAVNETTLKIVLERPYPAIIPLLARGWMVVYPKKVVEEKGDMKKDVVGSGPFKYKEYKRGVSHELVKNEDYFVKGRPYLDGIMIYIVKEPATRLAAVRARRALAILPQPGITPPEAEVLKKEEPDIAVLSGPFPLLNNAAMNTKQKPWDDVRVRRALHLALDRQAAVQFVLKGAGVVGGLMPPGSQWAIPNEDLLKMPGFRQPKDADIAEAKRLLAEAGVRSGVKVNVLARAELYADLAVFLQSSLTQLGFDASTDIRESAAAFEGLRKGDFGVAAQGIDATIDDPDSLFGEFLISNVARNYARLVNPKVDELFEKQSRTLDPTTRKNLVIEMQRAYLENVGMAPVAWQVMTMVLWKGVKDYKFPFNTFNNTKLQDVWLAN